MYGWVGGKGKWIIQIIYIDNVWMNNELMGGCMGG